MFVPVCFILMTKTIHWLSFLAIAAVLVGSVSIGTVAFADKDDDDDDRDDKKKYGKDKRIKKNTGVLVYTHGIPTNPLAHMGANDRITAIENHLEQKMKITGEKITHMPYWWNNGLMSLDKSDKDYSIFLYTDMFGPDSTVIHDLTRGYFGGVDGYTCPPWPSSFGPPMNMQPAIVTEAIMATPWPGGMLTTMFEHMHVDIDSMLDAYGDVCWYMGHIHVRAETFSDSKIIFAEPARPDHPILRDIFVKQAEAVTVSPEDEVVILVGHGARNEGHNDSQEEELSCAASHVENELGFAGSMDLVVREDWDHLYPGALSDGLDEIESMLSGDVDRVVLVHATGSQMGIDLVTDMLDAEGIDYLVTPGTDEVGEDEMVAWAEQTVKETVKFIKKDKPTESAVTPYWDRDYSCE